MIHTAFALVIAALGWALFIVAVHLLSQARKEPLFTLAVAPVLLCAVSAAWLLAATVYIEGRDGCGVVNPCVEEEK